MSHTETTTTSGTRRRDLREEREDGVHEGLRWSMGRRLRRRPDPPTLGTPTHPRTFRNPARPVVIRTPAGRGWAHSVSSAPRRSGRRKAAPAASRKAAAKIENTRP